MTATRSFQVHTQARGPHWIGWITESGQTEPYRSVVLVAANEDDARARATRWAQISGQAGDDELVNTAV